MNPIAVRLVQNGSRRSRHLYIRATYLAVLIVALLWLLLLKGTSASSTFSYKDLAAAGAAAFTAAAYLQVLLICVLAPVFMGGAIAQEASPRTWEVLLTTPMTASEIVLGNLFGRLFFIIALLTASLPLFALTQYFGGVPYTAVFASYLVAACAALVVGAIAIALSVSRLVGKRAFFVFYVCVVSYIAVTLAIDIALRQSGLGAVNGQGVTYMTALNPFLALRALLNPATYPRAPEGSYTGLSAWMLETPVSAWCIGSSLVSAFFMAASTLTVRTGGLQTLTADAEGVPWHRRLLGRGPKRAGEHRAPKHVWTNPIAWREAASRNSTPAKIALRYAFLLFGAALGLSIVWMFHRGTVSQAQFQYILVATVWTELTIIALVAINTAATAISKEREDGTLDLLLTTPITASAYLKGKLRGLIAYLLPLLGVPLGTLAMSALYVLIGGFSNPQGVTVTHQIGGTGVPLPLLLPESALLASLVVVPFMAFCVMVGLQWSLKSKGTLSSVVATVGVVGAISAVLGVCAWNASDALQVVGPVFAGLSPASYLYATVHPEDMIASTMSSTTVWSGRVALLIGAGGAALVYSAACYAIHGNMVRTFDMTVRRLAGNR